MNDHLLESALSVGRRRVLKGGICAGVGLICACLGGTAVPYLLAPPKRQAGVQWIKAGELRDFAPGNPHSVSFRRSRTDAWKTDSEEANAWVVNQGAGRITAFSPICTHLGCLYRWQAAAHQFVCPCHGSRFAISGEVLAGPAPRPLDRYEVRLEGGAVWLKPEEPRS